MFPLPRILYAMASDGLVFRWLAVVNETFQTPLRATIVSGILTGVTSMLFDLTTLVDMMSIGTLMAYSIVSAAVILLRYQDIPGLGTSKDYIALGTLSEQANVLNHGDESDTEDEEIVYCRSSDFNGLDNLHQKSGASLKTVRPSFGELCTGLYNGEKAQV